MKPYDPVYAKRWKIDNARGIKRKVPADRSKGHIEYLMHSCGATVRGIAEVAGLSRSAISIIKQGTYSMVMAGVETKILAVTPEMIFCRSNPRGFVAKAGGVRRIRALVANGWRYSDLSEKLGFRVSNIVFHGGPWISQAKHEAIKALYEQLWDVQGPSSASGRARALKGGKCLPPMAWDDDTIDLPEAMPDLGARVLKHGRRPVDAPFVLHADAVVEDVEFLLRDGQGWEDIAERLGSKWQAIERQLQRAGRPDLVRAAKTDNRNYARRGRKVGAAA